MTIDRTPTVRVYVRESGGKRNFYPAPRNPDLAACYWLQYEKDGKQSWQRVGHYDLVAKEKLLLERRLSAEAQGLSFPRIKQLKETPLLVSQFVLLLKPIWNLSASKSGRRNLALAKPTNSVGSRAPARSPIWTNS
jgi:hypothetical protein